MQKVLSVKKSQYICCEKYIYIMFRALQFQVESAPGKSINALSKKQ